MSAASSTLLLEPIGGIAGDMLLGLLIDLGAPLATIRAELQSLDLSDWSIELESTTRRSVGCTRVRVGVPRESEHRHLPEILARIERSTLPRGAKARATQTFELLAQAEGRVHRVPPEQVHFHEVGAADAILDICGCALALELLGIDTILCGELPGGRGTVRCEHGELPLPVPAVVELLAGRFPIIAGMGEGEQVTPTGAALLAACATPLPSGLSYLVQRIGYGGGTRPQSLLRGSLVQVVRAFARGGAASLGHAGSVDGAHAEHAHGHGHGHGHGHEPAHDHDHGHGHDHDHHHHHHGHDDDHDEHGDVRGHEHGHDHHRHHHAHGHAHRHAHTHTHADEGAGVAASRGRLTEAWDGEFAIEDVVVLTAHVDDMTGEDIAYLLSSLMNAGALDASATAIWMKKGRPGHAIACICHPAQESELSSLFFAQSSTLGLRREPQQRRIRTRASVLFSSTLGPVRLKISAQQARPEFDDLAEIAVRTGERIAVLRQRIIAEYDRAQGPGDEASRKETP